MRHAPTLRPARPQPIAWRQVKAQHEETNSQEIPATIHLSRSSELGDEIETWRPAAHACTLDLCEPCVGAEAGHDSDGRQVVLRRHIDNMMSRGAVTSGADELCTLIMDLNPH